MSKQQVAECLNAFLYIFRPRFAHSFCFVAAGSTVRVYSVSSSQLVSTLKPPTLAPVPVAPPNDEDGQDQVADTEEAAPAPAPAPVEDPKSEEGAQQDSAASPSKPGRKRNRHGPSKAIPVDYHQRDQSQTITALYINPLNTLQLITTSLDGFIRAWDFLEGKLMRSIDMKWPITAACTVEDAPASVADEGEMEGTSDEKPTHNYIFVTLEEPQKAWDVAPGVTRTVYMVPLEQPSRQLIKTKLGRGKDIFAMTLNSKRDLLIAISRYRIFIFFLPGSPLYGVKLGSVISFGAFNTNNQKNYDEGSFTSLAAHPTEDCFATGEDTGRIRVWYILETSFLQRLTNAIRTASRDTPDPSLIPQGAASILHWHAHAVTAVRFTPNGAYLLSGGEEATLVLWHMASTTGHKEFIPRLGAPINAITVTVGPTREQEFAARLRDGTVSFVGAGTLKVVRSLATVKTGELSSSLTAGCVFGTRGMSYPMPIPFFLSISAFAITEELSGGKADRGSVRGREFDPKPRLPSLAPVLHPVLLATPQQPRLRTRRRTFQPRLEHRREADRARTGSADRIRRSRTRRRVLDGHFRHMARPGLPERIAPQGLDRQLCQRRPAEQRGVHPKHTSRQSPRRSNPVVLDVRSTCSCLIQSRLLPDARDNQ